MHATVRTLPMLALGIAVPAAVLVGALALPAQAAPESAAPSAQSLLAKVTASTSQHYSGTVSQTSDLGLPQLPTSGPGSSVGSSSESAVIDLLTADHTAKVYVDGRTKQRVQVLDQLAERDVIRDGSSVWTWDSSTKAATHVVLPSRTASTSSPSTPSDLAAEFLKAVDSSTAVTVASAPDVAGRSVQALVLTPRTSATLVSKVVISVDTATGVPLQVAVDARGQSKAAVQVGFTDVSFSQPAASVFSFAPPSGAKVTTKDLSSEAAKHPTAAPHPEPSGTATPKVTGTGWATIVALPSGKLPSSLTSDRLYGELTTAVAGGRALQTSLVSVLITNDGRVLAGAVPISALEAAAQ